LLFSTVYPLRITTSSAMIAYMTAIIG